MEIRQLKYFLKLAETLNFSEASRELFITQSTLSQQILNLERELDQQLFIRNSHEVVLTEAGRLLVPMARESIHTVDNCLQQMQDLKHLLTGELNIGVTYSFSSIMAETMIDFLKKYPKVKLNVCYSSMAELIDKVTGHTDHHYKIKVEINTIGLLFKLVSQTKYVTVLSESTVIDEPNLRAIPIDVPGHDMEGCIHTLKNGYMKASAREFIHLLRQSTAILKNSTLKGM